MASRINIAYTIPDTRASVKKNFINGLLPKSAVTSVSIVDSYVIDHEFSDEQLVQIAQMLTNSTMERYGINELVGMIAPEKFAWAIEIGFLPGVTDNVGSTVREGIGDLLGVQFDDQAVYTSQILFLSGAISDSVAKSIAGNLYNPLIQRANIVSYAAFKKGKGMAVVVPKVKLNRKPSVSLVNLEVSKEELEKIGKEGIKNADGSRRGPLALDVAAMGVIRDYFKGKKRKATDVELESLAQTWSEHCKHTIFADPLDEVKDGLFNTYIKGATEEIRRRKGAQDFCVSVFMDNSGAIEFDENYLITDKVETHNSPSALDPFGGAITGIVGVNRDTLGFGLAAKPIINKYGFCFAYPDDTEPLYRDARLTQKMLSPKRIFEGVVEGVRAGGNQSGIPTPQGFLFFDKRYKGKPLVFVGTVGLIPKKVAAKKAFIKKAQPGDYIVMVGGRVGQDGIHGATFSSESLNTSSPASAVQIGDPITQKKMSDAIVKEARGLGLISSITDNGAGGLSSSVGEMAKESGGCVVHLDKVPLKYPGLNPWQIWISESQERMTLAVSPKNWEKLATLFARRGVEATVIGEFTQSNSCVVFYHTKKIMEMEMDFLHDGRPIKIQKTTPVYHHYAEPVLSETKNFTRILKSLLQRPNIASFMFISQQYDHEVQAGSVLKPLQGKGLVNGDASITCPLLTSQKGVVLSYGINPGYSDIDTYHMAACAIDTAVRNAVCAGVNLDRLALMDNFCWSSSDSPERLFELKRAVQACYDYAVIYGTPFISGKDSMFNDFKGYDAEGTFVKISVPPTLLISGTGIIDNVQKAVSMDLKFPGDAVYLLGDTHDELGSSEYFRMLTEEKNENNIGNAMPKVNAEKNLRLYRALAEAIEKEYIASAISVHRGGLAIGILRTAMAGMMGIDISLKNIPGTVSNIHSALFSESQGRVIISVNPKNETALKKILTDVSYTKIGQVTKNSLVTIKNTNDKVIARLKIDDALGAYRSTFKAY